MRVWLPLILSLALVACATNPLHETTVSGPHPKAFANKSAVKKASDPNHIVKSPHGYVIDGPRERFGGFIGDCASDANFPLYWQCQSENAGNDFH